MNPDRIIATLRNLDQADKTCLEGQLKLERERNATIRQLLEQAMSSAPITLSDLDEARHD